MPRWLVAAPARRAVDALAYDLNAIFGPRLQSLAIYGPWVWDADEPSSAVPGTPDDAAPIHSLALVRDLSFTELAGCAERTARWELLGLAIPLLLSPDEFHSSLDAFPVEFGDIMARHVVAVGSDPFGTARVPAEDLRRACEVLAKSHLIHLREGFVETGGRPDDVERLIRESLPSFTSLLSSVARLEGRDASTPRALARFAEDRFGISDLLVVRLLERGRMPAEDEPLQLFAPYHDAVSVLASRIDRWQAPTGS